MALFADGAQAISIQTWELVLYSLRSFCSLNFITGVFKTCDFITSVLYNYYL